MSDPKQFLKDIKKTAREEGITIRFINSEDISTNESKDPYLGYFDSIKMELAVAVKRPQSSYYGILAHESSHMDQFLENKYLWNKHQPGRDIFLGWLNDEIDPDFKVLEEAVQDVLRVELDCERRVLKKIKKYNLPIDISRYIQEVNADMYRYLFALETKVWLSEHPGIIEKSSTKLKKCYVKIPRRVYRELRRIYRSERIAS